MPELHQECPSCKSPVKGELSECDEWKFYWFKCLKCGRRWTKLFIGEKTNAPK